MTKVNNEYSEGITFDGYSESSAVYHRQTIKKSGCELRTWGMMTISCG